MNAYHFVISPLNCSESDAQKLIISVTSGKLDRNNTPASKDSDFFSHLFWEQYPYQFNELVKILSFSLQLGKWDLEIDLYENTGWKCQGPTQRLYQI